MNDVVLMVDQVVRFSIHSQFQRVEIHYRFFWSILLRRITFGSWNILLQFWQDNLRHFFLFMFLQLLFGLKLLPSIIFKKGKFSFDGLGICEDFVDKLCGTWFRINDSICQPLIHSLQRFYHFVLFIKFIKPLLVWNHLHPDKLRHILIQYT